MQIQLPLFLSFVELEEFAKSRKCPEPVETARYRYALPPAKFLNHQRNCPCRAICRRRRLILFSRTSILQKSL